MPKFKKCELKIKTHFHLPLVRHLRSAKKYNYFIQEESC